MTSMEKKPKKSKTAKAKKSGMKFVGVLIEESLHDRLQKQAKAEGGSVSFLIRRACKQVYEAPFVALDGQSAELGKA